MVAIGAGYGKHVEAEPGAADNAAARLSSVQLLVLTGVLSGMLAWLAWQHDRMLLQPQAAILYEAPSAGAAPGNVIMGSAAWRFVPDSPDGPELSARLDLPQRGVSFDLSIHRNSDATIPASHLVVIEAKTPPNLSEGGIAEIPELTVRSGADPNAQGAALDGLSIKVADGLFWIGLANEPASIARNLALLRHGGYLALSLVYDSGQTATLVFGKGAQGDNAIRRALLAWGRAP